MVGLPARRKGTPAGWKPHFTKSYKTSKWWSRQSRHKIVTTWPSKYESSTFVSSPCDCGLDERRVVLCSVVTIRNLQQHRRSFITTAAGGGLQSVHAEFHEPTAHQGAASLAV